MAGGEGNAKKIFLILIVQALVKLSVVNNINTVQIKPYQTDNGLGLMGLIGIRCCFVNNSHVYL